MAAPPRAHGSPHARHKDGDGRQQRVPVPSRVRECACVRASIGGESKTCVWCVCVQKHKVFDDLFGLSTFLIPRYVWDGAALRVRLHVFVILFLQPRAPDPAPGCARRARVHGGGAPPGDQLRGGCRWGRRHALRRRMACVWRNTWVCCVGDLPLAV